MTKIYIYVNSDNTRRIIQNNSAAQAIILVLTKIPAIKLKIDISYVNTGKYSDTSKMKSKVTVNLTAPPNESIS